METSNNLDEETVRELRGLRSEEYDMERQLLDECMWG